MGFNVIVITSLASYLLGRNGILVRWVCHHFTFYCRAALDTWNWKASYVGFEPTRCMKEFVKVVAYSLGLMTYGITLHTG